MFWDRNESGLPRSCFDIHVVLSKRYAERPLHPVGKNFPLLRTARMLRIAQHDDFARACIGQKNISFGAPSASAAFEICRKYVQAKSGRTW